MNQRDLLKGARITVRRFIEDNHPEGSLERQKAMALIDHLFEQRAKELNECEVDASDRPPRD